MSSQLPWPKLAPWLCCALVITGLGCKVPLRYNTTPSATAGRALTHITLVTQAQAHPFALEMACSADAHAQGLMGRRSLAPGDGMMFVFADDAPRTFWMHDTPLALDMLFFNRAGLLTCIIDQAEPMTDTPRSCPLPSAYVVELLGGTAARLQLTSDTRIGDIAKLRPCPAATPAAP